MDGDTSDRVRAQDPPRARRATIRDVARVAGVSVATVSRVFNDSGPVNPETRRRIRDVARELRYAPNSAARSLSMRRTATLGVLLPDLHGEFFSEVIRGLDQTAQRHHYHLLVSSSHNDRAEVDAAIRAMRGRVDGLLLMSPDVDAEALIAELPDDLPAVLLNCATASPRFDSLDVDNFGGARAMVRHLLELGHRRIAHIRGPARNHEAAERARGWRAALDEAGVAPDPALDLPGDFTDATGYVQARALLAGDARPTAIFAANDAMAIGALGAARDAGLRVPDDLAVAGFDDVPIARYVSPPLTTVHVGISELATHAAGTLIAALADPAGHRPRHVVRPTTLVVRGSCAQRDRPPPPSAG